ncbi:hypothetical protein L1887_31428 [Cichorium endivia]|nr:hypothetical protein L1887_31428 [Cichorium endivia]
MMKKTPPQITKSQIAWILKQENNWWVSKLIRKKHDSSVTSVAWHRLGILIMFSLLQHLPMGNSEALCWAFGVKLKAIVDHIQEEMKEEVKAECEEI